MKQLIILFTSLCFSAIAYAEPTAITLQNANDVIQQIPGFKVRSTQDTIVISKNTPRKKKFTAVNNDSRIHTVPGKNNNKVANNKIKKRRLTEKERIAKFLKHHHKHRISQRHSKPRQTLIG